MEFRPLGHQRCLNLSRAHFGWFLNSVEDRLPPCSVEIDEKARRPLSRRHSASIGATEGARLRGAPRPARPSPAGRRTPRPHPARPPSAMRIDQRLPPPRSYGNWGRTVFGTSPKTVDLADVHGRATACPFNSANEEARRSGGYAGSGHCQMFQEGRSGCDQLVRSCFFRPPATGRMACPVSRFSYCA